MNTSKELFEECFFPPKRDQRSNVPLPRRSPLAAMPANSALHPRIWVVPNDLNALLLGTGAEAMPPWEPAHGIADGREPTME